MADNTLIEWTDATWNPITGCSVVSPGCTNCYAMKLAGNRLKHIDSRAGLTINTKAGPVWNGQTRFNEAELLKPLRWKRPRRIFVCAHGDLFAESVPDEWIDRVFAVMALSPQHTFQVLTKRAARMRSYIEGRERRVARAIVSFAAKDRSIMRRMLDTVDTTWPVVAEGDPEDPSDILMRSWPLPNVWLGVSAEDQARADERIPELLATPAAIRFVSAEPLLGPIDFTHLHQPNSGFGPWWLDGLNASRGGWYSDEAETEPMDDADAREGWSTLDWIIVGGESGQGARPMHPDWARQIRDQCASAGVAFFFKQWGTWAPICAMSEDEINACYKPNRLARAGEDQDNLNDIYGRAQVKDAHILHGDGSRHKIAARDAFLQGTGAMTMFAIGKKRAGRLLDGIKHNAMPQVRP